MFCWWLQVIRVKWLIGQSDSNTSNIGSLLKFIICNYCILEQALDNLLKSIGFLLVPLYVLYLCMLFTICDIMCLFASSNHSEQIGENLPPRNVFLLKYVFSQPWIKLYFVNNTCVVLYTKNSVREVLVWYFTAIIVLILYW